MVDVVLVEQVGSIQVVTLNRPEARNAVNAAMAEGIAAALDELDMRDDLVIGVITGAKGTFCAGMDLKAFLAGEKAWVESRGFAGVTQRPPRKPLVAAVEGYALAGGFEVVLACDLVVAAESAKFGIPEVKRGLIAGGGGLLRLPERIPYHHAMEWALTGGIYPASRASELGLVNRLVPEGEARDAALDLARDIARNGPLAVAASKQVIAESPAWPFDERFDRMARLYAPIRASEDAKEGARAFAEKRAPIWEGR
jgi:enoyl-CoA hydratase